MFSTGQTTQTNVIISDEKNVNLPSSDSLLSSPTLHEKTHYDATFWLVFLAVNASYLLALLESSIISTSLPTIVNSLRGTDFVWVGAAYNLSSTACMPAAGGFSEIFGRRPILLASLILFSVGSIICGVAKNIVTIVAGRAVQGIGGAGSLAVSTIILSDIVPLRSRGAFNGILQMTWVIAAGAGPIIGGALSQAGAWRWIFYLNLPIAGVACILVIFFLRIPAPPGSVKEKISRIDWIGDVLVICSTIAVAIGLTWGGVTYPWSSGRVIAPLCIGIIGLVIFVFYELYWARHPIIPTVLRRFDRTVCSGYIQAFILLFTFIGLLFYIPIYFQACKLFSPTRSGVALLGLALSCTLSAVASGILISLTKRYRLQSWIAWCLGTLGTGLMCIIDAKSSIAPFIGFQVIAGVGFGTLYSSTVFPILAPLPISENARALGFMYFLRQFAQIWSITIGGSVLQNELARRVNAPELTSTRRMGESFVYSVIPKLRELPPDVLPEVQQAFALSLRTLWYVLLGTSLIGLLSSLIMRDVPLHAKVDERWNIERKKRTADDETSGRDPESNMNSSYDVRASPNSGTSPDTNKVSNETRSSDQAGLDEKTNAHESTNSPDDETRKSDSAALTNSNDTEATQTSNAREASD